MEVRIITNIKGETLGVFSIEKPLEDCYKNVIPKHDSLTIKKGTILMLSAIESEATFTKKKQTIILYSFIYEVIQ